MLASKTFSVRWNGAKWLIDPIPDPAKTGLVNLNGVSCTSRLGCVAVGDDLDSQGSWQTLVERWNGKIWSILPTPTNAIGLGGGWLLFAVACPRATNCFAAGWNNIGGLGEPTTLVEQWKNGKTWSIVTNPRPAGFCALNGVSCTSPASCTTVGWSATVQGPDEFGPPTTLVQHWNGTTWSTITSPNPGTTNSQLGAVSCTSTTNCVAVGQDTNAGDRDSAFQTSVERWNGTTWSTIASPNSASATNSVLAGVSCTSTTNCVAVGSYTTATVPSAGLFEHWNGATWSIVTTPTPSAPSPAS